MGKNKKSIFKIFDKNAGKDVEVDSLEEWQFYNWILELYDIKAIVSYEYQPNSFILTEKRNYIPLYSNPKNKEKSLLRSHEYTADFKIMFDIAHGELLSKYFKIDKSMVDGDLICIYVDIKGKFQRNDGGRAFSINQKLVYDKFNVLIQKVVPIELFSVLGMPVRCLKGYGGKSTKIFASCNLVTTIFGK